MGEGNMENKITKKRYTKKKKQYKIYKKKININRR